MHILIFGATGGTGKQLISQGLDLGHKITAFVRNPEALKIKDSKLSIVQGNILNASDVKKAIKGHNVVISVLGIKTFHAFWRPNTVISEGIKNIIEGMKANKVKRLLFLASFGVNKEIFYPEKVFIKVALKNLFADIPAQERIITESNLNWTIIHPSRLTNDAKTGKYRIGEHVPISLFSHISRADVADFLLKNLRLTFYNRKVITITN